MSIKTLSQIMFNKRFHVLLALLISHFVLSQNMDNSDMVDFMKQFDILMMKDHQSEARDLLDRVNEQIEQDNITAQVQIQFLYSKFELINDDFEKGKLHAKDAYDLSLNSEDELAKAYGLYAMCYYYNMLDLPDMAFDYANKILASVDIDKHPYLATQVYYKLYAIHINWDEADQADAYSNKAIKYAMLARDYDALANAYAAKSTAMETKYRLDNKKAYRDSILYYLRKSIQLSTYYPKEIGYRTHAIAKINIANHFFQEFRSNNIPYDVASDSINFYLSNVENISDDLDKSYQLRASALGMKAQLLISNNEYVAAEKVLLKAYEKLLEEKKSPAYYTLYNITIGLYYLYDLQGDHKKAFEFLKENQVYKDSVYNKEKIHDVRSLEAQFELDKMNEEVAYLENESQFRKMQNYLLITVCLLILVILYFIRKSYGRKMALEEERAISLEAEKAEAEAQINLEQEKQARLVAERKILKLENEKMQKEVIVSNLQITRKNELLQSFRDKIAHLDNAFEVDKSLKQEKRLENSLNETVQEFEDINPNFFNQLKEKSDNKLTPLDLKYCAYFHLRLGTKEIAQIFKVEPKSIRMKKYRIKRKLKLPKEISLEEYFDKVESN